MTHPDLVAVLAESCQELPDARAGVCADLRSGAILASQISEDSGGEPSELAEFAMRAFASGGAGPLSRLWSGAGAGAHGGDEVVVLEPQRCIVLLRSATWPTYALIFVTGDAVDVGLVIARTHAIKARFEEALHEIERAIT